MCGLVGSLRLQGGPPVSRDVVRQMAETLNHRGPDGGGLVSRGPCVLGFRRLAIIDLEATSTVFCDQTRSIWSVANAEIYNFAKLKGWLEGRGHTFDTKVDTEILPHLWQELGTGLVERLNGMFAFAIWDERQEHLMLGRDRAGEKPLFYWHDEHELVFASELRALMAHPRVPRDLDPIALRRFLLHGYFPTTLTPINGIRKLSAGHFLQVREGRISVHRYWDLAEHFNQEEISRLSSRQTTARLDELMAQAVARRRRCDVPVGVFLSGGIDSSAILAHLTDQVGPGVQTFSLGHRDRDFDESRFARRTAHYFKADFHELILDEEQLEVGLRLVGEGMDEPLGDASIIPTHLLSLFAREKVKVVLSGEGADELFAGYPTYIGNKVASFYGHLPLWLRRRLAAWARSHTPVTMGNVGMDYLLAKFISNAEGHFLERHHNWFGSLAPKRHEELLSRRLMTALQGDMPFASAHACLAGHHFPDNLARLLYSDFFMYLQDNLLTKVDRMSMLASLEARAPFLDHDLTEFAAGIPSHRKLKGITTKAILRRAVARRLPREVLSRRKRGFNIPFSRWLLHGLGQRLLERFSPDRVTARGLFDPQGIATLVGEHMSRQADHRKSLFAMLVFDMWCDKIYGPGTHVPLSTIEGVMI